MSSAGSVIIIVVSALCAMLAVHHGLDEIGAQTAFTGSLIALALGAASLDS